MIKIAIQLDQFSDFFYWYIQVFSYSSTPEDSAFKREVRSYEALPDARTEVDQLGFWAAHQEQFPLLSYLVRVIFPVPAASSKSERVFSVAGNNVTPKRNQLSPKQVEKTNWSLTHPHYSVNAFYHFLFKGGELGGSQVQRWTFKDHEKLKSGTPGNK